MKKTKFGILGAARIAETIVSSIQRSNHSEVTAIASRSYSRARKFAKRFRIDQAFEGYLRLIEESDVDVIYISLPNALHFDWIKISVENKKHVLCEKPLVLELSQLHQLRRLATEKNVKLMEAMWYRFHPQTCLIKDLLCDGKLGGIQHFHSTLSYRTTDPKDIRWNAELGGGALFDLFCYHADAVNHILSIDHSKINYIQGIVNYENSVEASIFAEMFYDGKSWITLSSSIEQNSINWTTIFCENGHLIVPNLRMFPGVREQYFDVMKGDTVERIYPPNVNAYDLMIDSFVTAIRENKECLVSIDESAINLKLMLRIRSALPRPTHHIRRKRSRIYNFSRLLTLAKK